MTRRKYEENHKRDVSGKRDLERDIREWTPDRTKGACVIWCGRITFWHLVVGVVGLKVTGIWGGIEVWRHQSRRWWPDTPWNNEKGEESE